jgi:hypothetical protein
VETNYKVSGLVRRMAADLVVCTAGTMLPDFDLHVPMLSLPAIFGTTARTVPACVPYLAADRNLAEHWRPKLGAGDGLLVGLVWAGNAKPDPKRSATFASMAALARVPGVSFILMQPPPESDDAKNAPEGMKLINLGPELRDFADTTASVLANLDLLITIDTGVAHLAGAMGIPTWVLLPMVTDWRWMLQESTTPWYPTVRLFRQPSRGDWESVIECVAVELAGLSERGKSRLASPHFYPAYAPWSVLCRMASASTIAAAAERGSEDAPVRPGMVRKSSQIERTAPESPRFSPPMARMLG